MLKDVLENNAYEDSDNVQAFSPEQKALWDDVFVCLAEIEEILHRQPFIVGQSLGCIEIAAPIASYLLAKASEYNDPFSMSFKDLQKDIDDDIYEAALVAHINDAWEDLLQLLKKHPYNVFCLNAVLRTSKEDDPNATPNGVAELATKLLNIQDEDSVAELCCGTGIVISSIKKEYPSVNATGYEIDLGYVAAAKVHNEYSEKGITFLRGDVFDLAGKETPPVHNKIFANYPFGIRLRDLHAGKDYLDMLAHRIPSISKATSSDWLYNILMTDLLAQNGRAIGIMTNGSTWNMIDAPIRKYFVENGLIECVIALPAKLFGSNSVGTSMIVLSRGNAGVRLVDASAQYTAGRRINELTEEDVNFIINLIATDSEKSFFIETEKLRENDYVLNTSRYLHGSKAVDDGAAFETVIKRITRGAPLNASQLDDISSAVPTNMQYLMLSNIQNGLIDVDLPYLTEIEKKNEKYCLTNHCLILSKNGYPYKIAVAEIKDGKKIMANGNLYLIELDEERVNPFYLAAYLGSENGTAALKSITVGATIPNIGVDQLKKLIIPLPDMEKQNRIAACYLEARDEITMLQLKLEKARNRMTHIFEEEA